MDDRDCEIRLNQRRRSADKGNVERIHHHSARVATIVAALTVVLLTTGLVAAAVVEKAPSTPEVLRATGKLGLSQLSGVETAEEGRLASERVPSTEAGSQLERRRTTPCQLRPFRATGLPGPWSPHSKPDVPSGRACRTGSASVW